METKLPPTGNGIGHVVITAELIVQTSLAIHRHRQQVLEAMRAQGAVQFDEDTFIIYPPGMKPVL